VERFLRSHPRRWAFLDTETTGLAGGAGTYAFLIGVGSIDEQGFRVRQFFMRDFGDESSLLAGLAAHLSQFDVLVTYNGKSYDVAAARKPLPHGPRAAAFCPYGAPGPAARREAFVKLRLDSCRLVELENRILGLEREGDLPGEMIPYYYFQYLRTQQAFQLRPDFSSQRDGHRLAACLTAVVPFAFRTPEDTSLRHGADLVGLARWLAQAERYEEAIRLYRRAWIWDSATRLLFKTQWEIGRLEKSWSATSWRSPFTRTWRRPEIPIACRLWKSWPSITSAASATTAWPWK